jgi:hypothetical protein
MLQFLSIETYNSPALLIPFSLNPREKDKEYPLYIQPIIKDTLWEIRATGSTLAGESRFNSFTVNYDHPIAYLRMGFFTLRVILDDGTYHFKSFPEYNSCVTQEEVYMYLIDDCNELIDETFSVLAEMKDERVLKLSQVGGRQDEYLSKRQALIHEMTLNLDLQV